MWGPGVPERFNRDTLFWDVLLPYLDFTLVFYIGFEGIVLPAQNGLKIGCND